MFLDFIVAVEPEAHLFWLVLTLIITQ
jgi:hypothetical protein